MSAPLLPLALAFALGVGLGLAVDTPVWLGPVGFLAASALLLVGRGRSLAGASAGVLVLCALAGWARVTLPDPFPSLAGVHPGPAVLEGLIGGSPEVEGPRTRVPLVLQRVGPGLPASGALSVSFYGPAPPLAAGDHVRITGEVRMLEPFRNPGADAPGGDRRTPRYFATARASDLEGLPRVPLPWWLRTRLWIHAVIGRHLPPVSGALLEGLLIGERRQLPPTLLEDFRRAGVYHVLAISGFNVALVAGSVFLLFRLVRLPAPLAATLALATLVAFAAVVGGQPSVLRATVMGGLFLAAGLLGRESRVWNSLAAALLALLALDPESLAEPGLQLSFAATAGLLHLASRALDPCATRAVVSGTDRERPLRVGGSAARGHPGDAAPLRPVLAARRGGQPPGRPARRAPHDGRGVDPGGGRRERGPRAPLVPEPLAPPRAPPPGRAQRRRAARRDRLPGAAAHRGVAALGLVLVLLPWVRGRSATAGLVALVGGATALTIWAAWPEGLVRVVVLDVGQGEAILVQAPEGATLLVDTGGGGPGRGDRGERVVVPALRRLGIRRLTALALTEGAPDHAGGLTGLLAGVPIGEVWIPDGSQGAAWLEPVVARGIPWTACRRGDRRWIGSVLVTALHPPKAATDALEPEGASRAEPLLLRIDWGLFAAVLATGSGAGTEATVLRAGQPLSATVLKVSDNGSRRGSRPEFLAGVEPRVAVIPVSARNPFGHPAPAVLARLGAVGAMVYRTDRDGAVDIRSDGRRVWVRARGRPGLPVELPLREQP